MPDIPTAEARPTEARLLHMVFPDHTNHLGTLFGGQALAWMDMAAFIVASRWARSTVVTARSEQVDVIVISPREEKPLIPAIMAAKGAGIPVILLTTESDDELKRQARESGATGWIVKPFKQDQLLAVIRKVTGA